jgi:hypothetical protein
VAHDGLLRGGELLSGLTVLDIIWDANICGFDLHIDRTKTCRTGAGIRISFKDYGGVNAVSLMRMWFNLAKLWGTSSCIFPARERNRSFNFAKTASADWFRKHLKKLCKDAGLDASQYSLHSLRAGGATDLFVARVPYPIIKKWGRWVSDAAMIYYRDDEDVVNAVFEAFKDLHASRR